ncbi:MAG: NlpC/P60 family protein [Candidatus Zixiibacteriota bacterium]
MLDETPKPLDIARLTAISYIGTHYLWGGDDPLAGFDCSGFVIEILRSAGKLPLDGDWTAAGLFEKFRKKEVLAPFSGCLVFYAGVNARIFHVEFCLSDKFSVGASGGDSTTDDIADAIKQNAYIKIRPIQRANFLMKFVDPFAED